MLVFRWQRIAAVLCFFCIFSIRAYASDSTYCGALGERTFSIPKEFFYFPPEREGDTWVLTKQRNLGCNQKMKSITVQLYYPGGETRRERSFFGD